MNAPPSTNPSEEGTLAGLLKIAIGKSMQALDGMLPARVIAYDRATNRATVQPVISVVTTGGAKVSRAQVASVPVFQYAGGGFVMSFPLVPGDLGWIQANDRDISLFLQSLDEDAPNTARSRSFSDGVFFPDRMRQFTLDPEDADRVVIQSADGGARVAVGAADVVIAAGGSVATMNAAGVQIEAPLTAITGNVTISGTLVVAGIPFATHKHTGVTAGMGQTGGPVA